MGRKSSVHKNPVLLGGVGILVLMLVGVLVWFLFFRPPVASTPPGPKPAAGEMQGRTNTPPVAQAPPADRSTPPASPSNPQGPYKGFWYGLENGEQLATLIEDHLKNGRGEWDKLSDAKCAADGSCAAPMHYLESFQEYDDPGAAPTNVSQLPAYIRKLTPDCTIKGRFEMADIYLPVLKARGKTETHRMSRYIEGRECVLKNPVTGRPVLAMKCANPVGKRIAPPPPPPPPCVTLTFHSKYYKEGKVHWGVGSTTGRLKDDACNAQRQGNGPWVRWSAPCDECIPPVNYLRRILGGTAQWVHTYVYGTTHRKQTLRFSTEVWTKVVYICLGRDDGSRTCGVYMRPQDWKGRHHVTIPDHLWLKDENNCPE